MGLAGRPDKRKIVAVIGSGGTLAEGQRENPFAVGAWIARRGHHLLTGGGSGVMEAAGEGFCSVDREGIAIGIIPAGKPPQQYPNRWVELSIFTHLEGTDPWGPDSRNHINMRSSDAVAAFPGGAGTQAELELALSRPRLHGKVIVCLSAGERIGCLNEQEIRERGIAVTRDAQGVIRFLSDALE